MYKINNKKLRLTAAKHRYRIRPNSRLGHYVNLFPTTSAKRLSIGR